MASPHVVCISGSGVLALLWGARSRRAPSSAQQANVPMGKKKSASSDESSGASMTSGQTEDLSAQALVQHPVIEPRCFWQKRLAQCPVSDCRELL